MRQIILDTETTGREISEGHRIIEIGCLEMVDRRLTKRYFHHYLNPQRQSEAQALQIHGLTSEFLKDKPLFKSIMDEFLVFIKDAQLIIHNAPFDLAFLDQELILAEKNSKKKIAHYCQVLDTLPLARQLHPGQRNNLDALCKRYTIDNSKRAKHGALQDAELLAHVYLAMTGGQTNLFEETKQSSTPRASENQKTACQTTTLPIIYATIEELSTHEKNLTHIRHMTGHCLWPTSPSEKRH